MSIINDKRHNLEAEPMGYLVVTDEFLSGWGEARDGRSLYALAFHNSHQADALEIAARYRSEMKRPRITTKLKADGTPDIKLGESDHLSVVDFGEASEWYKGAAANWVS